MPVSLTQPVIVSDTIDFTLNALKDGVVWDLTGATVSLYLLKPDKVTKVGPFAAALSDAVNGVAHYQVASTVIDRVGTWQRQWRVVLGSVQLWSKLYSFDVYPALA
jgi:hypothetical protein